MTKRMIAAGVLGALVIVFGISGYGQSPDLDSGGSNGNGAGAHDDALSVLEDPGPEITTFPDAKRYVKEIRIDRDSVAPLLAQLLPTNLRIRTRDCAGNHGDEFRVAIFGLDGWADDYLAGSIATGLSRLPFV
ncbi:hypothetical protein HY480_03505 [Candidatus Uhrbacteria bacterium]|nr:hypothetical protein [Candidatus Uhrbacteria bacterium]